MTGMIFWLLVSAALFFKVPLFPEWLGRFELFFFLPLELYAYRWPSRFFARIIVSVVVFLLLAFTIVAQGFQHAGYGNESVALRNVLITVHIALLHYSIGSAFRIIIPLYSLQPYDPSPQVPKWVRNCLVGGHIVSVFCNAVTSVTVTIVVTNEATDWI